MSTNYDWYLGRLYGHFAPIPDDAQGLDESNDAYGNALLTVTHQAAEWNLARNAMYSLLPDFDGYYALLDGYETCEAWQVSPAGESSVTDSTGKKFFADREEHIVTTKDRHMLSYKAPDSSVGDGIEKTLRIIKKCARRGR